MVAIRTMTHRGRLRAVWWVDMNRGAQIIEKGKRRILAPGIVWLAAFACVLLLGVLGANYALRMQMHRQSGEIAKAYSRLSDIGLRILDQLDARRVGEPCSQPFLEAMHKVAFRSDGINAIAYASGSLAICSTVADMIVPPAVLDPPDITADENPLGFDIWFNHNQSMLGFPGMIGTMVRRNGFVVVVPPSSNGTLPPLVHDFEVVLALGADRYWHQEGVAGLYESAGGADFHIASLEIYEKECDSSGFYCAATRAAIIDLIGRYGPEIGVYLLLAAIVSSTLQRAAVSFFVRYSSFESRFLRGFNSERLVCHYQPILRIGDRQIAGLEVLVRWRDSDGALLTPEHFLPVVKQRQLCRKLTRFVIARAKAELVETLEIEDDIRLYINIEQSELCYDFLYPLLGPPMPLKGGGRLHYALEIIESEGWNLDAITEEIKALQAAGIETYIDDFGIGYANIGNLAELPIDGVKLDRSFAMACEASLLGRMLPRALELVVAAGHKVIVEGVETSERFSTLCDTGKVHSIQGFFIARPMPCDQLSTVLRERERQTAYLDEAIVTPAAAQDLPQLFRAGGEL